MSSPISRTAEADLTGVRLGSAVNPTSALALSGLLKVQRRWALASLADLEVDHTDWTQAPEVDIGVLEGGLDPTNPTRPDAADPARPDAADPARADPARAGPARADPARAGPADAIERRNSLQAETSPVTAATRRSRLPIHLEDSEWSRLALGIAAEVLTSIGVPTNAEVLQLDPDSVTVHVPTSQPPQWPFSPGRVARSWTLARDSHLIAALPITRAIASAARKAALVTLYEMHGRRALVDLVAVGSTIITGPLPAVGAKIADVAVELGSRRWSDLETLVLVSFDRPMPRLEGTRHTPDVASALAEVTGRSVKRTAASTCVIVPPWASDPNDPLLGELIRFCERTAGIGVVCCASAEGALCRWELACEATGQPALTFGDGHRIQGPELTEIITSSKSSPSLQAPGPGPGSPGPLLARGRRTEETGPGQATRNVPIEIAVLGNVQVNGAPESFRYRRRLTELVAFLAMHPEGATTDAFATALWPERRVPLQTLANRLSETRRALGLASDGRPRLRKQGRRHLIAEAETDWDRFKHLASETAGADSWRRALALVRGRPFDGLDRGEWAQFEGYVAGIEAAVVTVACRLGEHALDRGDGGLAHWAALQGLLVSPWDERLYRLSMRAADTLGNRGGVDAALRSLALALELEGDPLLGIHPETSALYRSLTSRSHA